MRGEGRWLYGALGEVEQHHVAAGKIGQRSALAQHRVSVHKERELVAAMNPDRQLVRPLLVVVPEAGQ